MLQKLVSLILLPIKILYWPLKMIFISFGTYILKEVSLINRGLKTCPKVVLRKFL